MNDRVYLFLCRMRQIKHEDYWEDLFRLLLFIDYTMLKTYWEQLQADQRIHQNARVAESQAWDLMSLCAYAGLYEFINWVFKHTQYLNKSDRLFNATSSMAYSFPWHRDTTFSVKMLETFFEHAALLGVVSPHLNEKIPIWYYFLQSTFPTCTRDYWQAVEIWLRHRANANVSYYLRTPGSRIACIGVGKSSDRKGMISLKKTRGTDEIIQGGISRRRTRFLYGNWSTGFVLEMKARFWLLSMPIWWHKRTKKTSTLVLRPPPQNRLTRFLRLQEM